MGCNCASKEQIEKLHALYGEKINPTTSTTIKFKIEKFLTHTGIFLIMVILFPFLIGFLMYNVLIKKNNKISLSKFFGLKGSKYIDAAMAKSIIENTNIAETNV
jgi:hypothetical protein